MNKLSLFSGIGGDDLASDWAGIKTVCFVEKDKFCQRVLRKHWHDTPIIEDVKDVTREKIMGYAIRSGLSGQSRRRSGTLSENGYVGNQTWGEGAIDIISGGFPCQPHSVAGKHKGSGDERDLWGEFRRIIGEIKPRWVVAENVPGIFSSDSGQFFRNLLRDLAALGYSAGWCTFGAVDVGAWHRRDRVFIVAYSRSGRFSKQNFCGEQSGRAKIVSTGADWLPNYGQEIPRTLRQTEGYSGGQGINPASFPCGQDAADTTGYRGEAGLPEQEQRQEGNAEKFINGGEGMLPDTQQEQCNRARGAWNRWAESTDGSTGAVEPGLDRMADGLSYWLDEPDGIPRVATGVKDRVNRLKCLGNAVVPAQIYQIYKAIVEVEAVKTTCKRNERYG